MLLERLDLMPPILLSLSKTLMLFDEELLEGAELIADNYALMAKDIQHALAQCPSNLPPMERVYITLQILRGSKSNEADDS